jgi:hypothetical protein
MSLSSSFSLYYHLEMALFKVEKVKKEAKDNVNLWSISQTFYERICANILAPKKVKNLKCMYKKALSKTFLEKNPRVKCF